MTIQFSKLAKMKGNSQRRGIYSMPWSCTAAYSHPQTDQISIKAPHRMYTSSLGLGKAASKGRALKYSCFIVKLDSLFM